MKKVANVPTVARRYLNQLSKAALLELAYDLAAPRAECADDPLQVLVVLDTEARAVCARRGDRAPKREAVIS